MARKKRTIIDEDLPQVPVDPNAPFSFDGQPTLDELDLPDADTDALQAMSAKVKTLGISGEAQLNVYQIVRGGISEFRFTVDDVDSFNEAYLQDVCGPGKYAIRLVSNKRIVQTQYVSIGPKPVMPGTNPPATSNPTYDAATIQAQMYKDQLAFTQNLVLALITKANNPAPLTPLNELVAGMAAMHQLNGAAGSKDPLDLLIKGLEIGKSFNGTTAPDWKTELMSTVKEVGGPIAREIARHQLNGGKPALPEHTEEGEQPMVSETMLKQGLKWMKGKILSGLQVEQAVDWILNNSTDPMYTPFIALAVKGTFEDVVKLDPEIASEPYNSWVRKALTDIKEAYARLSSADDSGSGEGDTSDAADNETPSVAKPA